MVSLISIYDGHKLRKVFGWGDSKIIMLAHLLRGGGGVCKISVRFCTSKINNFCISIKYYNSINLFEQ